MPMQGDWVRIKVQACGVCHSDMLLKEEDPFRIDRYPGTITTADGLGSKRGYKSHSLVSSLLVL
jgi:hypothetical protein